MPIQYDTKLTVNVLVFHMIHLKTKV